MELTKADLEVVRLVLEGSVSLKEVATDYPVRHKMLVAVAILVGARVEDGDLHDGTRSLYGFLLGELVREPGVPEGGWSGKPWPAWYSASYYLHLVDRSRYCGFHGGGYRGAGGVTFVGNAQLAELVNEKPAYTAFCNAAFQGARTAVLKRRAQEGR